MSSVVRRENMRSCGGMGGKLRSLCSYVYVMIPCSQVMSAMMA
jgi:hypothetical protein